MLCPFTTRVFVRKAVRGWRQRFPPFRRYSVAPQKKEAPVTDVEATHNAQVVEEAQLATAAPSGGDPVPLGLLVFALGSTVLGISLLGYVPLAVQGNTIMPIVFA